MKTNEILAVMDREAKMLTDDNWHAAAAIMSEAAERLRLLAARLRGAGLSVDLELSPLDAAIGDFMRATGADRNAVVQIPDCDEPDGLPELQATIEGVTKARLTSGEIVTVR